LRNWIQAISLYKEPRILSILFLGFSSGLPFLLTLATLHVRLSEVGVNKTTIGFFVFVTLPYTLKFLWAPIIDSWQLPFFYRFFGKRKGWMLATQLALMISLVLLGISDPSQNIWMTAGAATLVAFCSATQDSVIEAYRVELLDLKKAGVGAGASVFGYRLGMWVAGAGALYLASYFSWLVTYIFMSLCVVIGIVATLLSHEPKYSKDPHKARSPQMLKRKFRTAVFFPMKTFIKREDWSIIILFILFYKFPDTVLNVMSVPFLVEIGFTKLEIANVAKFFGIGAMMCGGLIGGILLMRKPLIENLFICSFLQVFSCLMFIVQAYAGHNILMLFATIGIENFACGMGTAAFITYISSLCRMPHTATHYALLSSFGSFARVIFSSVAGWLADRLNWHDFYTLSVILCLPLLVLLLLKNASFHYPTGSHRLLSKGT
jgi:PAT family beta-lactamase induction signal transducer AmpG